VQGAILEDCMVEDLLKNLVDFGIMEILLTFWTMFISNNFPLVEAEFTEELIAIIARVGVKNQLVAKFTV
jgi:hypothetical protein